MVTHLHQNSSEKVKNELCLSAFWIAFIGHLFECRWATSLCRYPKSTKPIPPFQNLHRLMSSAPHYLAVPHITWLKTTNQNHVFPPVSQQRRDMTWTRSCDRCKTSISRRRKVTTNMWVRGTRHIQTTDYLLAGFDKVFNLFGFRIV